MMANLAKTTTPREKMPSQWQSRAYNWGDGSGDLALPIPLNIQRAHKLDEHSIVRANLVDGRLLISLIDTTKAAQVEPRSGAASKSDLKAERP